MLIGYARVSTQIKISTFSWIPWKKRIEDKISVSRVERSRLAKALEILREGDTLFVRKLDRLGRSVKNLVDLIGELHKQCIQF